MFQKRRSMLGRRHLLAQQQVQKSSAQTQATTTNEGGNSDGSSGSVNSSWRVRSGKKKTPSHFDKASKEFKKKLFIQSPGVNYVNSNHVLGQDGNHRFLSGNFLNETGILSIPVTPSSSSRLIPVTPGTAQQRRADMEMSRYGPLPSASRLKSEPVEHVDQSHKVVTNFSYQKQPPASYDFDNLQPPASPGPSRLDRIILEEKLEQPKDPDDLEKIQSISLQDPNTRLQFSPPLSSTCIGTPDSGKRDALVKEEMKESVQCSGRKLSVIQEDCDLSVIEFEQNERTLLELDETIKESTINNTVKPNNVSCLEKILKDLNSNHEEESEQSWENALSSLENMERNVINKAIKRENNIKVLKQQIEGFQKQLKTIEKDIVLEFQENMTNIRNMKEKLKSLKSLSCSTENKENNCTFYSTCKKNQLDEKSKWFNSLKTDNPGLLKTPNPNRKINRSASWTPHSMTKVLHEQVNDLYDK